ncbi:MAG TPA: NAD(P)-dependent oxidoreductase [Marmoricola sp.]|nr:NAD(P)-dependent oxidoreductase [Marmoricola sp.]
MRIVVSGGTGVIGRRAVPALAAAGHDVVVLTRRPEGAVVARQLGATPVPGDLFDVDSLVRAYDGADAIVNLASRMPTGYEIVRRRAWRHHDALRTAGVGNVVAAARTTGVRRVVQDSASFLYADSGEEWITEQGALEITPATEPLAVAEAQVQDYACDSRVGVVLRLGWIVGDDEMTRQRLRGASRGRPIALGRPESWTHLVHTDDLGSAVVAALVAPSGVYNVGAEPVRKQEMVAAYAAVVGADSLDFMGPVLRRLAGPRLEPMSRSLRVSSDHFSAQTGWAPSRPAFDVSWLHAARDAVAAVER